MDILVNVEVAEFNTIHVVDDDEGVRSALTALLREHDYVVEPYVSAEEFLRSYDNSMKGCIILDIQMPGMNGMELQEKLISQNIFTPIIFVTGHGTVSWSVQAMQRGAVNFLEKPYDENILIHNIEDAFEKDDLIRRLDVNCSEALKKFETLTKREKQVAEYLVYGKGETTNKIIAKKLNISHRTVEEYRATVMKKMGAKSLNELIVTIIVCKLNFV